MTTTTPTTGRALHQRSTPKPNSTSLTSALSRFLVGRRVRISVVLFSSILTTEALLGVGWHRVDSGTDLLFGAAVAMVLVGLAIRSWSAGMIQKNSELATTGPYRLCRHPLYLGSFLMIIGFCLGTQPWINLPIVAPCVFVIYFRAIRSEELTLANLFGETWTQYSANTPRLIPHTWPRNVGLSSWSAAQWRKNREYQAVAGTLLGVAGMFAWYCSVPPS